MTESPVFRLADPLATPAKSLGAAWNLIGIPPAASTEPLADQKIAWRVHSHPVNRRPKQQAEITFVQSQ
jgi:hypothetical protein